MSLQQLDIPGFVDLQVNGHRGVDFSSLDLTDGAFVDACHELAALGTVALLPTLVSSSLAVYRRNLPLIAAVLGSGELSDQVPGIHLEGPFISPEPGARGAHAADFILPPDIDTLCELMDLAGGWLRLLTIAPELPGSADLIRAAVGRGVTVSLGHSLATDDDLARAVDAGAKALTHLGNGLPNQLPRHVNPIWAGLANDDLCAMLIADGHHLPRSALKSMIRAKGVGRVIVVSDASPLAGMPPGRYETLGNRVVLEESGRLHNPAKQCLVGSSATMMQCMNHLASLDLLGLDELAQVGYRGPLELISADPHPPGQAGLGYDPESRAFLLPS